MTRKIQPKLKARCTCKITVKHENFVTWMCLRKEKAKYGLNTVTEQAGQLDEGPIR